MKSSPLLKTTSGYLVSCRIGRGSSQSCWRLDRQLWAEQGKQLCLRWMQWKVETFWAYSSSLGRWITRRKVSRYQLRGSSGSSDGRGIRIKWFVTGSRSWTLPWPLLMILICPFPVALWSSISDIDIRVNIVKYWKMWVRNCNFRDNMLIQNLYEKFVLVWRKSRPCNPSEI